MEKYLKELNRKLTCIEKKLCESSTVNSNEITALQNISVEIEKLTAANLPSHAELNNPSAVTYTGFKSISFVCDGAIDVTLDGNTITYPYTLGATTILGSTIEADEASLNSIEFDGTGTVLVTIKK